MFNFLRNFLAIQFFGVASWWAEKLHIKASFVRLLFIYSVFLSVFMIPFYLLLVGILFFRNYFKYRERKSVFDL